MKKIISKRLNLVITVEVNQRKLLSVLNFFTKISKWLTEQSCRSDPSKANVIPFTNFHTMSTSDWTEAFKWWRDTTKQPRVVGLVYVAVPGNVHGVLTDAKAVRFISQITYFTVDTLENVTSIAHGICIIRPNLSRVVIYNCTCKVNAKS